MEIPRSVVRYFLGMTRSDGAPIAMNGNSIALQIPICRTTERYRAGQGIYDYANKGHDLAARPAGKFQFAEPQNDTERVREFTITQMKCTTWPPALRANSNLPHCCFKPISIQIYYTGFRPAAQPGKTKVFSCFFLWSMVF